ncbi:MAG: VOC family protein [Pseudomonadota bacterium]|nr:VOC family protein [Pseudomonadota bacterium]
MDRRTLLKGAGAMALAAPMPTLATAQNALPLAAPIHVGNVGLRTRDAEAMAEWYSMAVGLREIARDGNTIWMGAGGERLLALTEVEGLRRAGPREAGLYHTAFLLPTRADLGRWIYMAASDRLPVDGSADHRVSEAVYLTDPEGNGIEIYADTPQDTWEWRDGEVTMGSLPLRVQEIVEALGPMPTPWTGAPTGTSVGHVHLKVGDAQQAGQWWRETLGFDAVSSRSDAVFLSTGGYHHHIAVNEWMSAGAGQRPENETGLAFVELVNTGGGSAAEYEDDWGTAIRLV